MATPYTYFAIGDTLAAMVNLEITYGIMPSVLEDRYVPLTGLVRRRALSGLARHDGAINGVLYCSGIKRADLNTFMDVWFGGWNVAGVQKYLTVITEDAHYTPILAYIEKPVFRQTDPTWCQDVTFALSNIIPQSLTKTGNYTVTASDRLIYADTSSGSITLSLPAAGSVPARTVFSAVKNASGNSLILDPNGSELIDGASTKTITAQYSRVDIISTDAAWVSI